MSQSSDPSEIDTLDALKDFKLRSMTVFSDGPDGIAQFTFGDCQVPSIQWLSGQIRYEKAGIQSSSAIQVLILVKLQALIAEEAGRLILSIKV